MLSVTVLIIILVALFFAWFGVFILVVKYYRSQGLSKYFADLINANLDSVAEQMAEAGDA